MFPVDATENGLAWDSISAQYSGVPPFHGDFEADFRSNRLGDSIRRDYIAGAHWREDDLRNNTATIVNCGTGTTTVLDLAKKIYRVETFASGNKVVPLPAGASVRAITQSVRPLGVGRVDGLRTSRYEIVDDVLIDIASSSVHNTGTLTIDYSSFSKPRALCNLGPFPDSVALAAIGLLIPWAAFKLAEAPAVKIIGESPPQSQLAVLETLSLKAAMGAKVAAPWGYQEEKGNVRTIDDNDPIFRVPQDFKKES